MRSCRLVPARMDSMTIPYDSRRNVAIAIAVVIEQRADRRRFCSRGSSVAAQRSLH